MRWYKTSEKLPRVKQPLFESSLVIGWYPPGEIPEILTYWESDDGMRFGWYAIAYSAEVAGPVYWAYLRGPKEE